MKPTLFLLTILIAANATTSDLRAQIGFTTWPLPPEAEGFDMTLISNDGLVYARTFGGGVRTWFLGEDGVFVAPNVPPGFVSSLLLSINHQGYGTGSVHNGSIHTPAVRNPDGTWSTPMPGVSGTAHGVSNSGAVVGFTTMWGSERAFYHDAESGPTFIPTPPGRPPNPLSIGISGGGVIFGTAHALYGSGEGFRAFRYTPASGSVLLDIPPGRGSEAVAANDAGVIVGITGGFGHPIQPIKWLPDGTAVELTGINANFVAAQGINNRGDIVGWTLLDGPRALLWSDDYGAIDLNTLLTPEQQIHWVLVVASDINDHRQIVGWAWYDPDGPTGSAPRQNQLFMLTLAHLPEPASASILLLGLTVLLRRKA